MRLHGLPQAYGSAFLEGRMSSKKRFFYFLLMLIFKLWAAKRK